MGQAWGVFESVPEVRSTTHPVVRDSRAASAIRKLQMPSLRSLTGFLRARFYRTDTIADQFQELMLKGISVPTYEVSAMTMRNERVKFACCGSLVVTSAYLVTGPL